MDEQHSQYSKPLQAAFDAALRFLDNLDSLPVAQKTTVEELRQGFVTELPVAETPTEQVVRELAASAAPGLRGSATGRFYAWVIGGTLPAALAADWLVSAWDQNAAMYASSPASAVVEEIVGVW